MVDREEEEFVVEARGAEEVGWSGEGEELERDAPGTVWGETPAATVELLEAWVCSNPELWLGFPNYRRRLACGGLRLES